MVIVLKPQQIINFSFHLFLSKIVLSQSESFFSFHFYFHSLNLNYLFLRFYFFLYLIRLSIYIILVHLPIIQQLTYQFSIHCNTPRACYSDHRRKQAKRCGGGQSTSAQAREGARGVAPQGKQLRVSE